MKDIFNKLSKILTNNIIFLSIKSIDCINNIVKLLLQCKKTQSYKKMQKEEEKINRKINDVIDHGTINDLMNLKIAKILMFIISLSIAYGCTSDTKISIYTTKRWENHYMSIEDFKHGTEEIQLDENESIWVLSNTSLKQILSNTRK